MSNQSSRRSFLKTAVGAVASFCLPRVLLARGSPTSSWFLDTLTGEFWPVGDPVSWSLANAQKPILACARERLVTLDAADPQRVIRLVVRRCKLNLIESSPGRVVVHHWGQQGRGDLRPFFKQHDLAQKKVEIVLIERKREITTIQPGEDFLFGERLHPFWPWKAFWKKWQRRHQEERDDWTEAPGTLSGYAWDGVEPNLIPWSALKSAWRRTTPLLCLNCDQPTIMTNFGFPWHGMFNRYARFVYVCRQCRRSFEDDSVKDVPEWLVMNLDAEVWPKFEMVWDRKVKWTPPTKDDSPRLTS